MKKVGVFVLVLILFSVSVSAFSLTGFFSSLFGNTGPTVINTQANPIKVYPGQSLQNLVAFEDSCGVESATAYFPYEGGEDKVEMILTAGNSKKGTYSASWIVHDTLNLKWYQTRVVLVNKCGGEAIAYVDWQDPTPQGHPAEDISPGVFGQDYSGNWVFMNGSVGIGDTTPTEGKLVVNGNTYVTASIPTQAVFGYNTLTIACTGAKGVYGKVDCATGYAGYFEGGQNYFEGNVGIGDSTPEYKLDLENEQLGDVVLDAGSVDVELVNYTGGESNADLDQTLVSMFCLAVQGSGYIKVVEAASGTSCDTACTGSYPDCFAVMSWFPPDGEHPLPYRISSCYQTNWHKYCCCEETP